MTPTEQDKMGDEELTKAIYEAMQVPYLSERHDAIKQLIAADRKRVALEAVNNALHFETHVKPSRVQSLDENYISLTNNGISFGKNKPPYERVVIKFDKSNSAIRFHEPSASEYGISYKVGVNPATGVYGFRARPFSGILPIGYYKKIADNTYKLFTELKAHQEEV